ARREDIPALINHFMKEISEEYKQNAKELDADAITALQEYNWTGNIRELRNVVERLIILSDKQITKKDVETYIMLK
ncbi:MAG: sigma-54-dependent Fis family transcriptional regulator, partial [Flavipsychrobacter sp.]|nr:sigma-54-dependent Fis family transcriptional regulator [Flavipsychrobacter sp.]